jgi:hypothetical protein
MALWLVLSCCFAGTLGVNRVRTGCRTSNAEALLAEDYSENEYGGGDYSIDRGDLQKWNEREGDLTVVPYYFHESIDRNTSRNIRKKTPFYEVMKELSSRTCVEFKQVDQSYRGKALVIRVVNDCSYKVSKEWKYVNGGWVQYIYTSTSTSGQVRTSSRQPNRPVLTMFQYLCDNNKKAKDRYYGTVRHEFLHAFGLIHTQNRKDRDNFLKIFEDNIQPSMKSQYDICKGCETFPEVPYECNSIMHYKPTTGAIKGKKTWSPWNWYKRRCDITKQTENLTKNDWMLLHKAAYCPGNRPNNPRRRRG